MAYTHAHNAETVTTNIPSAYEHFVEKYTSLFGKPSGETWKLGNASCRDGCKKLLWM